MERTAVEVGVWFGVAVEETVVWVEVAVDVGDGEGLAVRDAESVVESVAVVFDRKA